MSESIASTPLSHQIFVPFHLGDPAGILFFAHVFTLTHQTFERFVMERLLCRWVDWFQNDEWIVPIKETNALYFHPILAGEDCTIIAKIVSKGNSSFKMEYEVYQNEIKCCEVITIHVFCDRKNKKKIPIPAQLSTFTRPKAIFAES